MSPREYTNAQRTRLRKISELTYERELSGELTELEADFQRWRSGQIVARGLCERIHEFQRGPASKLFDRYDRSNFEFAVAYAIHTGLVSNSEAGEEVLDLVKSHLAFYRESELIEGASTPRPSRKRKQE